MQSVIGISVPAAVYEQAMKKAKSRNPKFLHDFLKQAAAVLDTSAEELQKAIDAETAKRERSARQDDARGKLEAAIQAVNGFKLPTAISKSISELTDICATLELQCEVTVTPDGTITTNVAASDVSSKSVISPWLAYERGQKMGDTFRLEKVGTRHYKATDSGEEFTNLTGWIRQNQPGSHAAAVLKRYGQL